MLNALQLLFAFVEVRLHFYAANLAAPAKPSGRGNPSDAEVWWDRQSMTTQLESVLAQ